MTMLRKAMLLALCGFLSAPGVAMMTDEDSGEAASHPSAVASGLSKEAVDQEMIRMLSLPRTDVRVNNTNYLHDMANFLRFHFQFNQDPKDPLRLSAVAFLTMKTREKEALAVRMVEEEARVERTKAEAQKLLALSEGPEEELYDLKGLAERVVQWQQSQDEFTLLAIFHFLEGPLDQVWISTPEGTRKHPDYLDFETLVKQEKANREAAVVSEAGGA